MLWKRGPVLYYLLGGGAVCGGVAFVTYSYARSHVDVNQQSSNPHTKGLSPSTCIFDALAEKYDDVVGGEEWGMAYGAMRWLLMKYVKGDALEISAGTGRNLPHYNLAELSSLTLSDLSKPMLEQAENKYFEQLYLGERNLTTPVSFCISDAHCIVAEEGDTNVAEPGINPNAMAAWRRRKAAERSASKAALTAPPESAAPQGTVNSDDNSSSQTWRIFKPASAWRRKSEDILGSMPSNAAELSQHSFPLSTPVVGNSHPPPAPQQPASQQQEAPGSLTAGTAPPTHKRLPQLAGSGSLLNLFRILVPSKTKASSAVLQEAEPPEQTEALAGATHSQNEAPISSKSATPVGNTQRVQSAQASSAAEASSAVEPRSRSCCYHSKRVEDSANELAVPNGSMAHCRRGHLQDGTALTRFRPGSFDTVVDTFGLCSHEDPVRVLREAARLLKPGGRLVLLEHGRASYNWLNKRLDASAEAHHDKWGCWWNKDILDILDQADLQIEQSMRWHFGTSYMIIAKPKSAA